MSAKMLATLRESDARGTDVEHRRISHFDAEIFDIVDNGDIEALELMVMHGTVLSDILDYKNRNLLHVACCQGNLPMVKYLVEQNVSVNQRDCMDYTPLYEAMNNWNGEIVSFLEENGAILISGILGSKLCKAASDGNILRLDNMLLKNPKYLGKINIADYDHRTALHLAACNGHMTTVKWLVQHGADPLRKDRFGNQPIDDAARYDHEEIVQYLEECKKGRELNGAGRSASVFTFTNIGNMPSHGLRMMHNARSQDVGAGTPRGDSHGETHSDYVLLPPTNELEMIRSVPLRR